MPKVLVTGASGFIGSHLAEALVARGDDVACLVRRSARVDRLRSLDARLVCGDVTDLGSLRAAVAGCQVVYHLAGRNQVFRVGDFFKVNQHGGRNVALACAEKSTPPVIVWVSSLAAAGPAPDGRPRTETDLPAPVSHYGRSKREGERMAEQYADRVPITIIRPPMVFGEADPQSLAMFKPVARFGVHPVHGLGRHRFSLIHVADLVDVLILAAERGARLRPAGEADRRCQGYYFAASPERPTYAELGRMIGAALGRRWVPLIRTPAVATWIVAAGCEVVARGHRKPSSFNLDKAREVRAGSWLCCAQRAADELGFCVGASLSERLRQTVQWYQQNGWL